MVVQVEALELQQHRHFQAEQQELAILRQLAHHRVTMEEQQFLLVGQAQVVVVALEQLVEMVLQILVVTVAQGLHQRLVGHP
jgi:hypothetical protein